MPGVLTVRDEGASRRYVFEQQVVVGRDLDCNIPIASRSVSRRHALVEKTPNGWVVRDLGSANGTSVNGARVLEAGLNCTGVIRTPPRSIARTFPTGASSATGPGRNPSLPYRTGSASYTTPGGVLSFLRIVGTGATTNPGISS